MQDTAESAEQTHGYELRLLGLRPESEEVVHEQPRRTEEIPPRQKSDEPSENRDSNMEGWDVVEPGEQDKTESEVRTKRVHVAACELRITLACLTTRCPSLLWEGVAYRQFVFPEHCVTPAVCMVSGQAIYT